MNRRMLSLSVAAMLATAAFACGDGDGAGEGGQVTVTDAWARSAMADSGAVYMTITNDGDTDDRLVGASIADFEGTVEIHESMEDDGEMTMMPVDGIDVPAGETVMLEVGGYHVMATDIAEPWEVGSTLSVTLTFEEAGEVTVEAEVKEFVEEDADM